MAESTGVMLPRGPLSAGLKAEVERAVADLVPAGHRGAILAIAGSEGTTVTVATKLSDGWTLAAEASRKWSGPVSGRVMLMGTW